MATVKPTVSPAALYLANLSAGSQGMRQPLDVIARVLDADHDVDSYPWHQLTYRDTMAVRQALIARYKPGTVNKMLSALRGVLKQTWRRGLIEADAYHRRVIALAEASGQAAPQNRRVLAALERVRDASLGPESCSAEELLAGPRVD